MANKDRPSKELHLEESDVTLTMTYVVFHDILRFVGNINEALTSLSSDQETRDLVLRRLVTDAKKPVKTIDDLVSSEEVTIDIFEIEDALSWVMEHVTYFFMRTASKMSGAIQKFPEVQKLMETTSSDPSESGSKA